MSIYLKRGEALKFSSFALLWDFGFTWLVDLMLLLLFPETYQISQVLVVYTYEEPKEGNTACS